MVSKTIRNNYLSLTALYFDNDIIVAKNVIIYHIIFELCY